jgi:hypothetical protein
MMVGVLTVDVAIFEAQTLKDKRRVIQSLKNKLSHRFNVSVAEVAYLETPKRCRLGIAVVSNETRAVHSQLDHVVELFHRHAGVTLLSFERQIL